MVLDLRIARNRMRRYRYILTNILKFYYEDRKTNSLHIKPENKLGNQLHLCSILVVTIPDSPPVCEAREASRNSSEKDAHEGGDGYPNSGGVGC